MHHPSPPARPVRPDRHARTVLPSEVHHRLGHLALDLKTTIAALLADGAVLVLRYHDRGEGLEGPDAPLLPIEARSR